MIREGQREASATGIRFVLAHIKVFVLSDNANLPLICKTITPLCRESFRKPGSPLLQTSLVLLIRGHWSGVRCRAVDLPAHRRARLAHGMYARNVP